MRTALLNNETVVLTHLMALAPVMASERVRYHPGLGKTVVVPSRLRVKMTLMTKFLETLNAV